MTAEPLHSATPAQTPGLLDQFRAAARAAGQPETWIEPLASWVAAFIIYHGKRHPRELDAAARDAFLRHVVQTRKDPLSALATARQALLLLYENVLRQPIGELATPTLSFPVAALVPSSSPSRLSSATAPVRRRSASTGTINNSPSRGILPQVGTLGAGLSWPVKNCYEMTFFDQKTVTTGRSRCAKPRKHANLVIVFGMPRPLVTSYEIAPSPIFSSRNQQAIILTKYSPFPAGRNTNRLKRVKL